MKREFLQLANDFDPDKHTVNGMFMSEKMDGLRCFWDGGISRGVPITEIPWANRDAYERPFIATGLWTRYGHPFHAPAAFTDKLPERIPLDGELWLGRGRFEEHGFLKSHDSSNPLWNEVKLYAFNRPAYADVFQAGTINNPFFSKVFGEPLWRWLEDHKVPMAAVSRTFDDVVRFLNSASLGPAVSPVEQIRLPFDETEARKIADDNFARILDSKGEGLMFAAPYAIWTPKRTDALLKMKDKRDAEATVVGCVSGEKTSKGSKLLGLMGSLIVEWEGKRFNLSGFTNPERVLTDTAYAAAHPGEVMPETCQSVHFPIGTVVTFKYMELTADGIPRAARYYRRPV